MLRLLDAKESFGLLTWCHVKDAFTVGLGLDIPRGFERFVRWIFARYRFTYTGPDMDYSRSMKIAHTWQQTAEVFMHANMTQ